MAFPPLKQSCHGKRGPKTGTVETNSECKANACRNYPFMGCAAYKRDMIGQKGGHLQKKVTNLGAFVPVWLVLPRCEGAILGTFDLCHFDLLIWHCANSGVFGTH